MKKFKVNSLHELEEIIPTFGQNVLFRGQLEHYGTPEELSIKASFDRTPCIPTETMKWLRYASNVLEGFIGGHVNDMSYVQALLQHYGWRSFYVDCSSSPAVSAWFASHKYTNSFRIDMCEDCGENFIWQRKKHADYHFEDGDGHIYVIDKSIATGVGLVDLATLQVDGFFLRTQAQKAWLLGPTLGRPVPKECFIAQITASRTVLRDYAVAHGLTDTNSLFPSPASDPILKALLELPWREIESIRDPNFPVPVFKRTLELPEYQDSFEKIAPPNIAFYQGRKISEIFSSIDSLNGKLTNGEILSLPEVILFGSADDKTPLYFPQVESLLQGKKYIAFEIDEIIKRSNIGYDLVYQKGIGVISHEPELFEVCELIVMHPGINMTNVGFSPGWFYRREPNGLWVHEHHDGECSCNNDKIHKRHISALHIVENLFQDNPLL